MASKRQIKSREFIDDSDDPEDTGEQTRKKVKKTTAPAEDNTDDELIPLSARRFVSIRTFRGKVIIDIREYYEDRTTGETKPGKKGIALSVDQWEKLKDSIGIIDERIQNT